MEREPEAFEISAELHELTERVRRHLAPERQVALAELLERLPVLTRTRLEAWLERSDRTWRLEGGPRVLSRLAVEAPAPLPDSGAKVRHRWSIINRQHEPHEPRQLEQRIDQALSEKTDQSLVERLQPLVELVEDRDEVEVELPASEGAERAVITAQAVIVIDRQEQRPQPDDEPVVAEEPAAEADEVEAEPELPLPEPAVAEVEPAAAAQELPNDQELEAIIDQELAVVEPEPVRDVEVPLAAEAEPQPPEPPLADILAELEEALPEISDLPPAAGGAPASARRRRSEDTEPPPLAEPRPVQIRPERRSVERRFAGFPEWEPAARPPDSRMRRKARKLVRVLARRYRLRLTPEIEAYLMEILLRPKVVGGRKVYGLGLHVDLLTQVLDTLWLHYGDVYAYRPKPRKLY